LVRRPTKAILNTEGSYRVVQRGKKEPFKYKAVVAFHYTKKNPGLKKEPGA